MTGRSERADVTGLLYAVAAYGFWGFAAIYFRITRYVPSLEVLAHRIVWSVVLLAIILTTRVRWSAIRDAIRVRRTMLLLCASTTAVAINWYFFIWSIAHAHVIEASLGYFINPLVNVLLGSIVLGERLRRFEWASVGFAAIGVLWITVAHGAFPWISLVLATTFGMYGLLRKLAHVGATEGLAIETAILFPLALLYLGWLRHGGTLVFGSMGWMSDLLLASAGIITTLPLIWFANAVRRLRLATVGLIQYMSPTIQFLLAIFAFHEPFNHDRLIAFIFIWIAVAVYSIENFVESRKGK